MQHRPLGKTGISLPPVIFGTSALGNLYAAPSDHIKTSIVDECLSSIPGPVVFDTAGKYGAGLALEKLGEILLKLNACPSDIIISNKLGWLRTPLTGPDPTFEKGVWMDIRNDALQAISYDGIMQCWEQGNQLLGKSFTPQLVSVHDPDEYLGRAKNANEFSSLLGNILEAYRALSSLKAGGQVRAVGIGSKDWKTIRLISENTGLDWVMFANSMTIYRHPPELLEFMQRLHERGIAIINSAVFHAGFLTGGEFFDYVRIRPDSEENRSKFSWRKNFFETCKKHNVKPSDACVRFAMSPPGVISISLNTSDPLRVKSNVASVEAVIPGEFWKEMISKKLINSNYPYILNKLF